MPTISFFLRSNNDSAQSSVLYCRISLTGHKPSEFSLGEKVLPAEWNQEHQRFDSRNRKQADFINTLCDSIRYKLKMAAVLLDNDPSPASLKAYYKKPKDNTTPDPIKPLIDIVDDFIRAQQGVLSSATIGAHRNRLQNLVLYQEFSGKRFSANEVLASSGYIPFDLVEAERFKDWYSTQKATENVTSASRNIELYRRSIQLAVKLGRIKNCELSLYEGNRDKIKRPVILDLEELSLIMGYQFQSKHLEHVKDLFLFQVSTGFGYCNLYQEWTITQTEGGQLLSGYRGKNDQAFFVPVDELTLVLLEKYSGKLPYLENGTYNRAIKEIAAILGINKKLKTNTARKTFATLMDGNGWSRESISRMLGHKYTKTTETYYLAESPTRIIQEMSGRIDGTDYAGRHR